MTPLDQELLPLYLKSIEQDLTPDEALKLGKNWLSWEDWERVIPNISQQEIGLLLKAVPWSGEYRREFMQKYALENVMEENPGRKKTMEELMAESITTGEPFCVLTTSQCERVKKCREEHQSKQSTDIIHARGIY